MGYVRRGRTRGARRTGPGHRPAPVPDALPQVAGYVGGVAAPG